MFKHTLALTLLSLSLFCTQAAAQSESPKELALTPAEAVLMALERNRALQVERSSLKVTETAVKEQLGAFDPRLVGRAEQNSETAQRQLGAQPDFFDIFSDGQTYSLGLEQNLASGTRLALEASAIYSNRAFNNNTVTQQISRLGFSFTQALLQGRDPEVNLAQVRQAELAQTLAAYNLRGFAEALAADTEIAFWDYLLARQRLSLTEASARLARQQLAETRQRVAIGRLAEIDAVALEAELALREQEQVLAQGQVEKQQLSLLRLVNPDRSDWAAYRLRLAQPVGIPVVQLDSLETHLEAARKFRPELQQTRLEIQRQELEVIRTRDGLMPRLDLFVLLGKTGYAEQFPNSVGALFSEGAYDFAWGIELSYPLGLRTAEAGLERARLSKAQQEEALHNLEQLVELDVRQAYLDVRIAREQIQAAQASVRLQQAKLNAESQRYEVGRSTAFMVAQAQRDLLNAQLLEAQALTAYMQNLTRFYRLEGTLLQRYGVSTLLAEVPAETRR